MSHALGKPSSGKRKLRDLLLQSDNRICADCGAPDPKWASATIGVFICLKCCGVHRNLGLHISKVLSVTLDEWTDEEIDGVIEVGGNDAANKIYEAHFPEGVTKPSRNASHEERSKYIRSKYELQEFLKPGMRVQTGSSRKEGKVVRKSVCEKTLESIAQSTGLNIADHLDEYLGVLKIKVLKGSNLAVRDMLSSDPYIVLSLGEQKVQTTVVPSNLNPVWNQELNMVVPKDYGPIKLQVYDHDTFSADDIMGEAEIDVQPMITSALAFGDASMYGDRQIGKWLQSYDNALIEDSPVNIVDGKVRQELWLRLQNVESGEVELELEWVPLTL
ncbi:ADP-ribosylation factor GTPase-activating protein AGD12-like [Andrographis paniculata]|uniref:ADP-ribosylation factor GTPase-activating protein AGD12-like n=1 Tax=Andrographis paniculata TaxID=175694 RepID=UPI0021E8C569|nr:ADP-ribosylation factor GTPase-activating protein AGD12-like [Andrographis paniculata]XP_051135718.1 ADP-ribosylation factor GTPase-activating protein AGD12-like [Andrographis paniculata]XP_051135719.1 ADP-ribosylation factor GTPase-activating protein AGD12-like [Andrographis paniculata]XP_051135720.1 ADP-ribosylation factor GTPase-activating protein AGD12-like [Andrographis paniculata]